MPASLVCQLKTGTLSLMNLENTEVKVLIPADKITTRISELAKEIDDVINDDWLVVALLRGSFIFAADLTRAIKHSPKIDFMTVSSYGDKQSSTGQVDILHDLSEGVTGKNILLIDDIFDTGHTLRETSKVLEGRGAKEIITAVLLEKPARREVGFRPRFSGFEIPDKFVVGYGLDYANHFRTLPYIGTIKSDD